MHTRAAVCILHAIMLRALRIRGCEVSYSSVSLLRKPVAMSTLPAQPLSAASESVSCQTVEPQCDRALGTNRDKGCEVN
jgi:hypothetical protein